MVTDLQQRFITVIGRFKMAAIDLNQLFGGKQFIANVSLNSGEIPPASNGVLLNISGSGENRVRLDSLTCGYSVADQQGITITVDGVDIYTGEITSINGDGPVVLQGSGFDSSSNSYRITFSDIIGKNIVVTKSGGSTNAPLKYAWSEGR